MPGETPGQGQDFVAPDESQRIEDSEKARAMANTSSYHRYEAAAQRSSAKYIRKTFPTEPQFSRIPDILESDAQIADGVAEKLDEIAALRFDAEKEAMTIPENQLENELAATRARDEILEKWCNDLRDLDEKIHDQTDRALIATKINGFAKANVTNITRQHTIEKRLRGN